MEKVCEYCGTLFDPDSTKRRKYCSEECAVNAKRKNFQKYWETNKEKHQKTCREYQLRHKEDRDRRVKQFFIDHPEKQEEYRTKYRNKKKEGKELNENVL